MKNLYSCLLYDCDEISVVICMGCSFAYISRGRMELINNRFIYIE